MPANHPQEPAMTTTRTAETNATPAPASSPLAFEFKPAAPVAQVRHAIAIDGKVCGEVKTHEDHSAGTRWHATIDLRESGGMSNLGGGSLAQGFGPTAEDAIRDAIAWGRRYAADYARALEETARRLGA
jgi:hypothetical protein